MAHSITLLSLKRPLQVASFLPSRLYLNVPRQAFIKGIRGWPLKTTSMLFYAASIHTCSICYSTYCGPCLPQDLPSCSSWLCLGTPSVRAPHSNVLGLLKSSCGGGNSVSSPHHALCFA